MQRGNEIMFIKEVETLLDGSKLKNRTPGEDPLRFLFAEI